MKAQLKSLVGERGRGLIRKGGRARYLTKARKARAFGWSARTHPAGWLREVVLSPEVDTYTYALANRDELAAVLADALDVPTGAALAVLDEADAEPELGARLTRDLRHRVLWSKRRPALAGHHLSMWAAVRLLRPRVVVETGILDGLGSRTVLAALARNAAEGGPDGRLWSFDVMPHAGSLVPSRLAPRWHRVIESSATALDAHLGDAQVDLFLHDSLPDPGHQRFELVWALDHGARLAITTHGHSDVARSLAAERGARVLTFRDVPREHFYPGRRLAFLTGLP